MWTGPVGPVIGFPRRARRSPWRRCRPRVSPAGSRCSRGRGGAGSPGPALHLAGSWRADRERFRRCGSATPVRPAPQILHCPERGGRAGVAWADRPRSARPDARPRRRSRPANPRPRPWRTPARSGPSPAPVRAGPGRRATRRGSSPPAGPPGRARLAGARSSSGRSPSSQSTGTGRSDANQADAISAKIGVVSVMSTGPRRPSAERAPGPCRHVQLRDRRYRCGEQAVAGRRRGGRRRVRRRDRRPGRSRPPRPRTPRRRAAEWCSVRSAVPAGPVRAATRRPVWGRAAGAGCAPAPFVPPLRPARSSRGSVRPAGRRQVAVRPVRAGREHGAGRGPGPDVASGRRLAGTGHRSAVRAVVRGVGALRRPLRRPPVPRPREPRRRVPIAGGPAGGGRGLALARLGSSDRAFRLDVLRLVRPARALPARARRTGRRPAVHPAPTDPRGPRPGRRPRRPREARRRAHRLPVSPRYAARTPPPERAADPRGARPPSRPPAQRCRRPPRSHPARRRGAGLRRRRRRGRRRVRLRVPPR